ncbi:MAG: hypothetical protein ABFD17_09065, partial [Anaerolineaceae bacterium]
LRYKNYSCNRFTSLNPALFNTADWHVVLMGYSSDGIACHRERSVAIRPQHRHRERSVAIYL